MRGLQNWIWRVECASVDRVWFGSVGGSVEWIESGRKEVLTAVLNAVECASRWREEVLIESASG